MLPANGQNVKLGKGSLLLDLLTAQGAKTGFSFAGNAISVAVSAELTQAEIYSSTQRNAPLLASDVARIKYTVAVSLSEFTVTNLKLFLLGEEHTKTQSLASAVTYTPPVGEVIAGRFIDVGKRRITDVVVTRDGSQVLVLNTDYKLYAEFGIVELVKGGAVQDGDDIEIEFDVPALTIKQIRIAKAASPRAHMLYLSDDANQDGVSAQDRLELWKVSIAPEGELQLISDEYGNFQLTLGVLSDAINHPDDPFGTLDRIEAA